MIPRVAPPHAPDPGPPLLGELIEHLRRRGFTVGVDDHLRLLTVLDRLAGTCRPEELLRHLGPLLARTPAEQLELRRLWPELYPLFVAGPAAPMPPLPARTTGRRPAPRPHRRWPLVLLASAVLALLVFASLFVRAPAPTPTPGVPPPAAVGEAPAVRSVPQAPVTGPPARDEPSPATEPRAEVATSSRTVRLAAALLGRAGVLLPLAVALSLLVWRWRRHLVLRHAPPPRPPFAWPLRLPANPSPFRASAVRAAARALRRREPAGGHRLDVEATIAATVATGGRVEIRTRERTRPPEYVALIERSGHRDHQAELFRHLVDRLEAEDVPVERFEVDGDPRRCVGDRGPTTLDEIAHRFAAGRRLLVCGDGSGWLDPVSGELAPWARHLGAWPRRVLLTPVPIRRWGRRELALARELVVLPASTDALVAIAEPEHPTPGLGDRGPCPPLEPTRFLVPALRRYLGGTGFRWLAACAVHPELHWDVTLALGRLEEVGPGTLTEEALLRLVSLPWFREGAIPDPVRRLLIAELEPELEQTIRRRLVEILASQAAPDESRVAEGHAVQIAIHRARLAGPRRDERRRAERTLRAQPPLQLERDRPNLELLATRRRSLLDLALPRAVWPLLFERGLPLYGLRSGALLSLGLLATVVLWLLALLLRPATPSAPAPTIAMTPTPVATTGVRPPAAVPATVRAEPGEVGPEAETVSTVTTTVADRIGAEGELVATGSPPIPTVDVPVAGLAPVPVDEGWPSAIGTLPAAPPEPPRLTPGAAATTGQLRPEIRFGENLLEARGTLETGGATEWEVRIPLDTYVRPIDVAALELEARRNLWGQRFVTGFLRIANAAPERRIADAELVLVDADGEVVGRAELREELDEGENRLKLETQLLRNEIATIAGYRLAFAVDADPGAIRTLFARLGWGDEVEGELVPEAVEPTPGGERLDVPFTPGLHRLDHFLRPLDFHTVATEVSRRRITVRLEIGNPSDRDRRAVVEATLLGSDGEPWTGTPEPTQVADKVVEEGEPSIGLRLRWPVEAEPGALAPTTIRFVLRAQEED